MSSSKLLRSVAAAPNEGRRRVSFNFATSMAEYSKETGVT